LTYTIHVYNSALSTDLPGVLTDVVPMNTSFVSASDGGLTRTLSQTVLVSWTLPLFSPGESVERSFAVRVHEGVISGTQIVNDRYGASGYGNVRPGAVTAGKPVTTTVQEAGLIGSYKEVRPELTHIGSGNVLTYHLHIVNTGPVNLTGVHVYDYLPWEASTYQRDAVASSGEIESDIVSFQWTGDVAAFSSEILTFTVLADWDYWGPITNTAVISHPRLAEEVVAQAYAYVVPDRPVLQISKSATPDPVEIGAELVYEIQVTNMGKRASQLVVADTIPWNAEYVEGSASGDGRLAGNKVQWTIPALQPLESRSFSFSVRPLGWYRVINRLYSVRSAGGASGLGVPVTTRIAGAPDIYVVYLPLVLRGEP
jgi:uncharacterized repeat protein (TIGR01451 family)